MSTPMHTPSHSPEPSRDRAVTLAEKYQELYLTCEALLGEARLKQESLQRALSEKQSELERSLARAEAERSSLYARIDGVRDTFELLRREYEMVVRANSRQENEIKVLREALAIAYVPAASDPHAGG